MCAGMRTERERGRIISRYIVPRIGDRVFAEVRRKDIAELLDRIEDESGKPMADAVLKTFRGISKWVQKRDESYIPALTAGMTRVPKGEGRRKRILADDEIRAIWRVQGQYGDFVRLALLTAQRREKLITLRWDDIKDGVWTIRTAPREKGNPGKLKLPPDRARRSSKPSQGLLETRMCSPAAMVAHAPFLARALQGGIRQALRR